MWDDISAIQFGGPQWPRPHRTRRALSRFDDCSLVGKELCNGRGSVMILCFRFLLWFMLLCATSCKFILKLYLYVCGSSWTASVVCPSNDCMCQVGGSFRRMVGPGPEERSCCEQRREKLEFGCSRHELKHPKNSSLLF